MTNSSVGREKMPSFTVTLLKLSMHNNQPGFFLLCTLIMFAS
jgi:hypothetical protein